MNDTIRKIKNNIARTIKSKDKRLAICRHIGAAITVLFYLYFITHSELYTRIEKKVTYYSWSKILFITAASAAIIFLIYKKNNFSKVVNKICGFGMLFISPIFGFLAMEYVTMTDISELSSQKVIWNLIIIGVILIVALLITNSLKVSPIIVVAICAVFSIANIFVYDFRGSPIVAADMVTLKTAANVVSNYTLAFNFRQFFVIFAAFGFSIFALKLKYTKLFNWKFRIGYSVIACLAVIQFCRVFIYSDMLDGLYFKFFNPMISYRTHGSALTFVKSIKFVIVEKPENYSLDVVNDIIEKYTPDESENEETPAIKPNIIAIANESFADLSILGDIDVNEDYMPFFRSLSENCVKGTAYSSVFGGRTANSEFEFLTGNTIALVPPQAVAFELYINRDLSSLTSILKSNGYIGNNSFHPYKASGYNRPVAYPYLGFENFLSQDDMIKPTKIGQFITDQASFERVVEEYENARSTSSDPFYIYNLTVQNHGSYARDMTNLEYRITLSDSQYVADAVNYLNLIKTSDDSFEWLINYFSNVDEPTIIIMFGDHQPNLPKSFFNKITNGAYSKWSDEEIMQQYAVPFVIWANYDIEEKVYEQTSLNYLSTILMDTIGFEKTGYQRFLSQLSETIPVITANGYIGDDGKLYQTDDETSPYYDLIYEYKVLQYNNMFDMKNRVDSFFFGE